MSEHFDQLTIALQERYQLKAELGRGGMATVYLALDLHHGRRVAIKVLHPELAGAVGHDRFLREIRIASDLSHPHILPLLDSGSAHAGQSVLPFYVMPYVDGESLRARLQREHPMPIEDAVKIAHDVATALSYAHRHGVVHRDIKPENILLAGDEAVVADFGIARAIDRATEAEVITSAGLAVGTPAYMSPEQGAGHQEVDGRSDIYSLGCVLYEMLGGDPPFSGPSPNAIAARHRVDAVPPLRTIRPSVPLGLEAVVLRSLEKVPADRFKTAEHLATALGQLHTPTGWTPPDHLSGRAPASAGTTTVETPRPWWPIGRRTRRTVQGVALLTLLFLAAWWAISEARWFDREERYSDIPEWSAWRGWSGEIFPLFAYDDSILISMRLSSTSAQVFDGHRWTSLAIPDSFELVPYLGRIANGRLLGAKSARDSAGRPVRQYWWIEVSPTALRPAQSLLGDFPDDGTRPNWWSDGRDIVLWLEAIRRYEGSGWIREATGVAGGFAKVWGTDLSHRFAIPSSGESLLAFDGISWNPVPVSSGESAGQLVYKAGATFEDGATVVLGDECLDDERCRPFVLQQDRAGRPWRRVSIPDAVGVPQRFTADTGNVCDPSRFAFIDIFGRSREDYVVTGLWSTCQPGLEKLGTSGCPPRQPCTWRLRRGRLEPVADLLGKIVQAVGYLDTSAFALLDDGTLWRLNEDHWRPVTQVGELPLRMVGASSRMVVRMETGDIFYEPGHGDSESRFAVIRMDSIPEVFSRGLPPRDLVVRDTSAALLSAQGEVFLSRCRMERVAALRTGTPRGALRCSPWRRLLVPAGEVSGIAFLPDGQLIGVGPRGLALTWHDRIPVVEKLPPSAANETLWGLAVSTEGRAMAITSTQILERDLAGEWTTVRRIRTVANTDTRFAVLPDGDFVVVENSLQVWDRTRDSIPVAILYRPGLGEAIGALHTLADGRLIAGLAHSDEPLVGGRLLVWAAPVRANRSQEVQLPISVDITDLSDDGRFLHVAGRGGMMKIPLDSLPFPPVRH